MIKEAVARDSTESDWSALSTPEEVANRLADERDVDVVLFNGDIEEPADSLLTEGCDDMCRRRNVLLVIVTPGGDPHAAYRMARGLESLYDHFTAFIPGPCKSAGSLLVTGAHELVISDRGELGPLDVQMRKADELWLMNSGLTVIEAASTLDLRAYRLFEQTFLGVMGRSGGRIGFEPPRRWQPSSSPGFLGRCTPKSTRCSSGRRCGSCGSRRTTRTG